MSTPDSLASLRNGPTIVCLHCSGSSGRQWLALTDPLKAHATIRTPDLLGYAAPGGWPSGARVSLDDEVSHLAGLLDAANGPVHLLGHSYGAAVALQIALRRPAQVASLTLYEPVRFALLADTCGDVAGGSPEAGGERGSGAACGAGSAGVSRSAGRAAVEAALAAEARYQITVTANRLALSAMSGSREQAAEMFADYWGGPGTWASTQPRRRHRQAALMPKVSAEFQALFADRIARSAYESLDLPVHLIGGSDSPLPARMVMRRLAALLPRVGTVTIAGLGHLGPISDPERVRAYLPRWLHGGETVGSAARAAELLAA